MKTIALIALWPLFFGYDSHELHSTIMGDWLLQESYISGCFTSTMVAYKPDQQKMMHFSLPDRYTITTRDTLVDSGTFELTPQTNLEAPTTGLKLILTADQPIHSISKAHPSASTVYELTDSRLVIGNTVGTFRSRSIYTRMQ